MFCWKHYKNSIFRRTQLFKNTIVEPPLHPSQTTPFSKRSVIFGLGSSAETIIFIVFPAFDCFGPSQSLGQTICARKCVFCFALPDTNSVRQVLLKIHFCHFSLFWMTTFFIGFWAFFQFIFWFLFQQHKKTKPKNQFSFWKPHFWHPDNFAEKKLFWHNLTLFVF